MKHLLLIAILVPLSGCLSGAGSESDPQFGFAATYNTGNDELVVELKDVGIWIDPAGIEQTAWVLRQYVPGDATSERLAFLDESWHMLGSVNPCDSHGACDRITTNWWLAGRLAPLGVGLPHATDWNQTGVDGKMTYQLNVDDTEGAVRHFTVSGIPTTWEGNHPHALRNGQYMFSRAESAPTSFSIPLMDGRLYEGQRTALMRYGLEALPNHDSAQEASLKQPGMYFAGESRIIFATNTSPRQLIDAARESSADFDDALTNGCMTSFRVDSRQTSGSMTQTPGTQFVIQTGGEAGRDWTFLYSKGILGEEQAKLSGSQAVSAPACHERPQGAQRVDGVQLANGLFTALEQTTGTFHFFYSWSMLGKVTGKGGLRAMASVLWDPAGGGEEFGSITAVRPYLMNVDVESGQLARLEIHPDDLGDAIGAFQDARA